MLSVIMETQTQLIKKKIPRFSTFSASFGALNKNLNIAPHEDQHQTSVISKTIVNLDLCKVLC